MPDLTYKDLFLLVREEIQRAGIYPKTTDWEKQLSTSQVMFPVMSSGFDISTVTNSVMDLLTDILPPLIKSGLTVSATTPISDEVTIEAGTGTVGGRLYRLNKSMIAKVPFDSSTHIFYINLYQDGLKIERLSSPIKLTLAKIVIPKPGVTGLVQDAKDEGWNAYIVNFKEYKLYGDGKGNFEEDTIDLLRDNIGPVLADNLIGNIRLSEDLKIINTQGTVVIDSKELRLLSIEGNILVKFDKNGMYFYDENGIQIVKFGRDETRIGNIRITSNSIESDNFVSGALGTGFQLRDNGNAEFNNVTVRGKITTSVFEKNTISVISGDMLMMDADILDVHMTATGNTMTIEGAITLEIGDLIRIKANTDEEWLEVIDYMSGTNTYTVIRDKAGSYENGGNPAWRKGTVIINFKQAGDGGIMLSASEENSPYISVITHDGEPWINITTALKLGNLNGFLGETSELFGIAIGDNNNYLKYDPTNKFRTKNLYIDKILDADKDTGIETEKFDDEDKIRMKTGGIERLVIDSSGIIPNINIILGTGLGITDTDGDTKIQLEEGTDDDTIRFDISGTERMHLDGISLDMTIDIDFNKKEAIAMAIENRTSDPGTPATGQVWFRTDV